MKREILISLFFLLVIQLSYSETIELMVERGDTLYSLSQEYDVTVEDIMNWNNFLTVQDLQLGKKIKINVNSNQSSATLNYIVKRGDTFYRIAREHGITVNELLNLNNMSENDLLREGSELIINGTRVENSVDLGLPQSSNQTVSIVTDYQSLRGDWPAEGDISTDDNFQGWVINLKNSSSSKSVSIGKIVWSGAFRDYGNVVIVDSGSLLYFYGGEGDVLVTVGQSVSEGTDLFNGLSSGQRVYFSIYKGSRPIDYYNGVER